LGKGKGRYEGKSPFKCFYYDKIGHYASRCPKRVSKYKPKYENKCYYDTDEGVTNEEFDKDDEWVSIYIKEDDPKPIVSTSSMNVEKSLAA
jgi:hypothetical protein